ncbi:MAG: hypothetical protein D3917_08545 [Candidatus Electrothrix sp. AX5]|nr:hypothetical protein [Candidatus Electrothrix sp. AX5]
MADIYFSFCTEGIILKYTKKKAIGDAGEYFFAYTVATILGWPCRLLDIDIGIDAQVEILDGDQNSTGSVSSSTD